MSRSTTTSRKRDLLAKYAIPAEAWRTFYRLNSDDPEQTLEELHWDSMCVGFLIALGVPPDTAQELQIYVY